MKIILNNNKESSIYKTNSNLLEFTAKKNDKRQLLRVERENKVFSYGKNNYISKLINNFKSETKSGTKEYWMEVNS